jgi:hypothetical protein
MELCLNDKYNFYEKLQNLSTYFQTIVMFETWNNHTILVM